MIEKEQREVERRPITKITHKGEIEIESDAPMKEQEAAMEMVAISFSKSMYSNWRQLKCNVICKVMKPNIYI